MLIPTGKVCDSASCRLSGDDQLAGSEGCAGEIGAQDSRFFQGVSLDRVGRRVDDMK